MSNSRSMNKIRKFLTNPSKQSIQILSDLHLDIGQQYSTFSIPPSAPYLVLAGDIGRPVGYEPYLSFLVKHMAAFRKIFLVLGNHEFYGLSHNTGLDLAQKLEQEAVLKGRLVLLQRKSYDFEDEDVTLLGCTLCSKIDDDAKEVVKVKIKGFSED